MTGEAFTEEPSGGEPGPRGGMLDAFVLKLMRSDPSRGDVVKWVIFSRNLLALLLIAVLSNAALSTLVLNRQTRAVLEESLTSQGETIATALARAAFVPLALEDDAALRVLVEAYQGARNLVYIRVLDAGGKTRCETRNIAIQGAASHVIQSRVFPLLDPGEEPKAGGLKPVGKVEVGLSDLALRQQGRAMTRVNVGASAVLGLLILSFGSAMTGRLIRRMHHLVGEARLTQELRLANAELEAFSYSVSHDLRAPLRHIDGFSQALSEDLGYKLDVQTSDHIKRIREGCQRMGRQIDDLLGLSRVVRRELKIQDLDLSRLALVEAEMLQASDPKRDVRFLVASGIRARGDPGLLQAALENLIGNAWKFTQKTEGARIEFGVLTLNGKRTYFVRDNGAGFDMEYAGKLFTPFQRLHAEDDFPGTGIGLATVSRIVQRHGGRIWAEGVVGQGAVFYFTLGPEGGSDAAS